MKLSRISVGKVLLKNSQNLKLEEKHLYKVIYKIAIQYYNKKKCYSCFYTFILTTS